MNRPLLITIAGVFAVAIAIGLNYFFSQEKVDDKAALKQTTAPAPAQAGVKKATKPTRKPKMAGPIKPTFDVVRVNPKGDTVIAGRAEPGSTVIILDQGKAIGKVTADKRGEWAPLRMTGSLCVR